jgi:hypothetical protein
MCVGPPDTVIQGEATVLIGNMPASRLGDKTAHGGAIVVGCPTVLIGMTAQAACMLAAAKAGAAAVRKASEPKSEPWSELPDPSVSSGAGTSLGGMAGQVASAALSAAAGGGSSGGGEPEANKASGADASGTGQGQPAPLKTKEKEFFEGKAVSSPATRGVSYDTSRGKQPISEPRSTEVGVEHAWVAKEGALRRWGDDDNNFNFGSYGKELTSGVSYGDGNAKIDVIKASVHAEALSANAKGSAFNNVLEGSAAAKALSVQAEASLGAEWSSKAKDIHAKVGASADLVKAEVGGKINIPLFGHVLSLGGGLEGQIGASAEAQAGGGWTEEDGYYLGAKAKAGLGLGGGFNFSIGFK